jgi:hypothetical protein
LSQEDQALRYKGIQRSPVSKTGGAQLILRICVCGIIFMSNDILQDMTHGFF